MISWSFCSNASNARLFFSELGTREQGQSGVFLRLQKNSETIFQVKIFFILKRHYFQSRISERTYIVLTLYSLPLFVWMTSTSVASPLDSVLDKSVISNHGLAGSKAENIKRQLARKFTVL